MDAITDHLDLIACVVVLGIAVLGMACWLTDCRVWEDEDEDWD